MLKTILIILEVIVSLGLISTIILQSGRSAGLSGSIAGGSQAIFGGKKKGLDELLSRITTWLAIVFMIVTLVLAIIMS
ncbi:MAG: preprotein translocase subunit SecG [Syntrophomonadaceae bacterium]|nr:preprotein translocase subunit SecG [Syntrophomonadaceae bacterium]